MAIFSTRLDRLARFHLGEEVMDIYCLRYTQVLHKTLPGAQVDIKLQLPRALHIMYTTGTSK